MRIHEPGYCPDPLYSQDCDGIGHYGPDPFAEEVYGDTKPVWQCYGVSYGSAMDI